MEKVDFCVIGTGILGLATAFRLKRSFDNASVAIIGPEFDKHSATRCAGAMINVFAEIPFGGFDYPATNQKLQLLIEAEKVWDEFCEEISVFSEEKILPPSGSTHVLLNSRSTDVEAKTFEYVRNWCGNRGLVEDIAPNAIPGLNYNDWGIALRGMTLPDRYINPNLVLLRLTQALKNLGVSFINERVLSFDKKRSLIANVNLENGEKIAAQTFVWANGFDSNGEGLYSQLGVLPVFANGGCALRLKKPEWVKRKGGLGSTLDQLKDVIRMVDRGGSCGIHVVPEGEGSFYVGASSAVWTNPEYQPKLAAVQVLVNSAINEINYEFWHYDLEIIGNGFRPTTPDAMPLIGYSKFKNALILNGFKRDGFTSSPYASKLLLQSIETGENPIPLFKPTRKIISYKTRHEAINDALQTSAASMFQHYQYVSPLKKAAYRDADEGFINAIYKKVGKSFGIHPEMLHLYADNEFFAKFRKHLK